VSRWDIQRALDAVAPEVEEVERVRREVLAKRAQGMTMLGFLIAGALLIAFVLTLSTESAIGLIVAAVMGLLGGLIIHHVYFSSGAERYRMMFKERLLGPLIRAVEPRVSYEPQRGIGEEVFNRSGFFGSRPDRYSCEDLIHGMIGKTQVHFSEVHAEEENQSTDAKGNTSTSWDTIFQGIIFIADFHKEFRSPVVVLPDVAERVFGWFGKKMQKLGGNLQTLENPEFEKNFVVRGSDSVETRYILTPSMQERLLALRGRLGRELRVAFRESQVWIAIPSKSNWFEGNLKMPAGDRSQVQVLLGQLRCCFQIVEELDLNTRIWTKE